MNTLIKRRSFLKKAGAVSGSLALSSALSGNVYGQTTRGIEGSEAPEIDIDYWIDADGCLLYTSPSPRDQRGSRMPSSA